MKQLFKWFLMLNKRLYKKVAFLVILVMIPVSVFAFGKFAEEDSGFLHIVLAQTDESDSTSEAVINDLITEESIILFTKVSGPDEAVEAVKSGKADEAWIFPSDLSGSISQYVENSEKGFITIITREQNTLLTFAREKLTSSLYEYSAKAYYINFARTNVPELDLLSDGELLEYFDNVSISEEFFVYGSPDSVKTGGNGATSDYLTTPIRGLLSILVVMCGMAAAMYYMQDEKSGLFAWVSESKQIYVEFACLGIAVFNVAVVVMISLFVSGLASTFIIEFASIVLYAVCCVAFCLLLRQIFGNIKLFGVMMPLLTVVMIVLCPVFFDFRIILGLQLMFPPTYYVNSLYDHNYILYMPIYVFSCLALCALLRTAKELIKKRRR